MDFFAFFNCSLTLCLWCMPCHIYFLNVNQKRLDPRFSWHFFFWNLAFSVFPLTTCFKELPISVLYDRKNDVIPYDVMHFESFLFFFSINRVLAQCYSKSKWMYTCCMWFSKLMDIYSFVWSSPRTRVTSDNFKLSISETIDIGGLKCYCDLWSVPVCDSHKNQSPEIPHLVAMPTLH